MSLTPKQEKARILGQLYGIYKNTNILLTPTINQVEFEKAVTEDKIDFFLEDVVKSFATVALHTAEKEQDELKKSEMIEESNKDLGRLELVNVMFDNVVKSVYVDLIDVETKTYKDNALNRKFERVGQAVK